MEIRLQKWGNSDAIRIPSAFLKSLKLKTNDMIDLDLIDNKIVISKSKNNKISLEERFKNYKGEDLTKVFEWEDYGGNEIW